MKDLKQLAKNLDVEFASLDILKQAVVHRSYLNENPSFELQHNERLEFLGDAVLELVVTDFLYRSYDNPEGELTNWRASLVNAKMLASIAKELDVESYLYLSRGEAKDSNSKARDYILANAFEAVIGAIYIDQGYEAASNFIHHFVLPKLPDILASQSYRDPKSKFQEKAQEELSITPHYEVLNETGPDHKKQFVVGLFIDKELIAKGEGSSKQEAQEQAAEAGLVAKGW